jgi:predicted PurR-regulated permease PerM
MSHDIIQKYFFITSLFIVGVLVLLIFFPFIEVLALAIIFAVVLHPIHKYITKKLAGRGGVSSAITLVLLLVVIVTPGFLLGTRVLDEAKGLYTSVIEQNNSGALESITASIEAPIKKVYPQFSIDAKEYLSYGIDAFTGHLSGILSGAVSFALSLILFFIALYFFLKDGSGFKKIIVELSPLNDKHDQKLWEKIKNTINATIRGVVIVSVIQGILAGIGLFLFGVPNATLWGSISAIAALVPGLGTAIVFVPAILYMFFVGNTAYAVGLLLWGMIVVGLVDNFLMPYIYSRGVDIHPIIMLFAVLGGLAAFGPAGFIFGPIIVALFFSMVEMYQTIVLDKKSA